MEISLSPKTLHEWKGAVLVVGLIQEDLQDQLSSIQTRCEGSLIDNLEQQGFTAKTDESTSFQLINGEATKLVLIGLGELKKIDLNILRKAAAQGAKAGHGSNGVLGIFFPW